MKKNLNQLLGLIVILSLSGCVSIQEPQPIVRPPKVEKRGVYHKIRQGETLWRIAQAYNVHVDKIVRSNNIPNVAYIEKDQLIFIPGVDRVREISIREDRQKHEFSWPVKGKVLFYFQQKKESHLSKGIGIHAHEGSTVKASREGRIVLADYLAGYGYTVIIDHTDGYHSVYSQNSQVFVEPGQYVFKGDAISQVGRRSDLAFLHFEIRKNTVAKNPLYYLP